MLQHGKRPTITSRHGMVAAAHPLAAAAGARILSSGGNATEGLKGSGRWRLSVSAAERHEQ